MPAPVSCRLLEIKSLRILMHEGRRSQIDIFDNTDDTY